MVAESLWLEGISYLIAVGALSNERPYRDHLSASDR
jgi:hypothetical protein